MLLKHPSCCTVPNSRDVTRSLNVCLKVKEEISPFCQMSGFSYWWRAYYFFLHFRCRVVIILLQFLNGAVWAIVIGRLLPFIHWYQTDMLGMKLNSLGRRGCYGAMIIAPSVAPASLHRVVSSMTTKSDSVRVVVVLSGFDSSFVVRRFYRNWGSHRVFLGSLYFVLCVDVWFETGLFWPISLLLQFRRLD